MGEDNELLKYQLESMNENIKTLSSDVRSLTHSVNKLETLLFTDNQTGSVGVFKRVEDLEIKVGKIEEEARFKKRLIAIGCTLGGAVGAIIWKLVEHLFSK